MLLRIALLLVGLVGSYVGSLSFQENSGVDFALGAMGLLLAIVCFFFLAKGLWRILGCLTTFIIVSAVVALIFYAVSGSGMIEKLLNKGSSAAEESIPALPEQQGMTPQQPVPHQPQGTPQTAGSMMEQISPMLQAMSNPAPQPQQMPQQPAPQQMMPMQPVPQNVIKGSVSSIASGDRFRIGNQWIRLFGVAAPDINQTCADDHHRAYNCGYTVARKLKDLLGNDEVTCNIISISEEGYISARCSIGQYDLGAALVESGWAVAMRNVSPVYIPYEESARSKQIGLWAGQFYMPWEWAAQQQRMAEERQNVKVPNIPKPKKKGKSIFDVF